MSHLGAVLRALQDRSLRQNLPYALGRFPPVRRLYSRLIAGAQVLGAVPGLKARPAPSLFPDLDPEVAIQHIREHAAHFDLRLPGPLVAALTDFAAKARLRIWGSTTTCAMAEVANGRLPSGEPVVLADVLGVDSCTAARQVALDPSVMQTVSGYLGYAPIGVDIRLLASFVGDFSDEERRASGQTIEYHFDVHSYNFMYANYYLTDVDQDSGAHVMALGSHTDKPMRWMLSSARRPDDDIVTRYSPTRIRMIEGPAGLGFIQDSSCYHKVLAPVRHNRLMLHLRYY